MNIKVTFHNMPHSESIEAFARDKLTKITMLFKEDESPFTIEMFLNANKQHEHHGCELHIKTPHFDLVAHDEDPDMYIVITKTIDKMVGLAKKEKEKTREKYSRVENEKRKFYK